MTLVFNSGSSARARIEAAGRAYAESTKVEAKPEVWPCAPQTPTPMVEVPPVDERAMADGAEDAARLFYERPSMSRLLREVAKKHGVSPIAMRADNRIRKNVIARHEFFWRCRYELGRSTGHIGRFLHKDHTSVMHGAKRHQQRMEAGAVNVGQHSAPKADVRGQIG